MNDDRNLCKKGINSRSSILRKLNSLRCQLLAPLCNERKLQVDRRNPVKIFFEAKEKLEPEDVLLLQNFS